MPALIAWGIWSACIIAMAIAMALIASAPGERVPSGSTLSSMAWFIPLGLSFATVGALVESRRPGHVIGRLMLAGGVSNAVQMVLAGYAVRALFAEPGLPGGPLAAWLFNVIAGSLATVVALIIFTFPDGRVPLGRARIGLVLMSLGMILLVLISALRPGPVLLLPAIDNPMAVAAVGRHTTELIAIFLVLSTLTLVLGVSTFGERLRHAVGVEKHTWTRPPRERRSRAH